MGVLGELLRCWCADPKGRILLTTWAATVAGVTVRTVIIRRRAKRLALAHPTLQPDEAGSKSMDKVPTPTNLRVVQRLAVPRWRSRPVAWFALLTTGIGLRLVVQVKMSAEIGALGALLSKRDWPTLYRRQLT